MKHDRLRDALDRGYEDVAAGRVMTRLVLTEIARADLDSIRRYSVRTWGDERTTAQQAYAPSTAAPVTD